MACNHSQLFKREGKKYIPIPCLECIHEVELQWMQSRFSPVASAMTPEDTKAKLHRQRVIDDALALVRTELTAAMSKFPPFNSAHEGHSVIREEFDVELWEHVVAKQGARDIDAMRKEAVQVAAMAVRFVIDICNSENGQK